MAPAGLACGDTGVQWWSYYAHPNFLRFSWPRLEMYTQCAVTLNCVEIGRGLTASDSPSGMSVAVRYAVRYMSRVELYTVQSGCTLAADDARRNRLEWDLRFVHGRGRRGYVRGCTSYYGIACDVYLHTRYTGTHQHAVHAPDTRVLPLGPRRPTCL